MSEMLHSKKAELLREDAIYRELNDEKVPFKVRKLKLLEATELPFEPAAQFSREEFSSLAEYLEKAVMDSEKLPLIVRFACLPNQYSVPSFYIDTATDLPTVLHKVKEAISGDISIVTVMVQHATPRNKIPEKIVGRVRYEDDFSSPNEIVLELYKGSRTMRIFDTVSSTDNAFASFVKPHGGFMRPELRAVNCKISGGDIQDIMYDLETRYKEKIQLARKVFLRLASKKSPIVSLEFWYLDGEMTFADFD